MDYAAVWKDSLTVLWRKKALWLFGILLALLGQGEYGVNTSLQDWFRYPASTIPQSPTMQWDWVVPYFEEGGFFWDLLQNPLPLLLLAGLGLAVGWTVVTLLGAIVRGALIGAADEGCEAISVGESYRPSDPFLPGWRKGAQRAIPLFLLYLLFQIPLWLLALPAVLLFLWLAVQVSAVATGGQEVTPLLATVGLIFLCTVPLTCIGGLVGGVLDVFYQLAARANVIERAGILSSLQRAWDAFVWNPVFVLLTGLVFWLAGVVFGFLAAIPLLGLAIPLSRQVFSQNWAAGTLANLALTGGFAFVMVVLVGGVLTAFNQLLWTRLYRQFLLDTGRERPAAPELPVPPLPYGREVL